MITALSIYAWCCFSFPRSKYRTENFYGALRFMRTANRLLVSIAIQENNNTNLSDKIPHCSVKLPCSATARLRSFSLHCEIFSRNLYAAIFLYCYKIKAILRKMKVRDSTLLPDAVKKAIGYVRLSDCEGWFRSCGLCC